MNENNEPEDLNKPIRLKRHSSTCAPESYFEITAESNLDELQAVSRDYRHGESYCTRSMVYADYEKLKGWIRSRNQDSSHCLFCIDTPFHQENDSSCREPHLKEMCRDFEEGTLIETFPDGNRFNIDLHSVFGKSLTTVADLMEVSLRSSEKYQGAAPLAALPPYKRELLDAWLDEKLQERDEEDIRTQNSIRFDRLLDEAATCLRMPQDSLYIKCRIEELEEDLQEMIFFQPELYEQFNNYAISRIDSLDRQLTIASKAMKKAKDKMSLYLSQYNPLSEDCPVVEAQQKAEGKPIIELEKDLPEL